METKALLKEIKGLFRYASFICNIDNTILKIININQRGVGRIKISVNKLTAGMYLYSLVVDGKIVDTKQMLLTN
jgi:trimeric autotransporter adhesin